MEDVHRLLQTSRTGRSGAAGKGNAEGEVVDVGVGRGGGVCDCVGETVVAVVGGVIFEAAGVVEEIVCDEAVVGLQHERVLGAVVGAAVAVGFDLGGEGGHEGGASREDDGAGGVQGGGYGGEGFRGCEEGVGVLCRSRWQG